MSERVAPRLSHFELSLLSLTGLFTGVVIQDDLPVPPAEDDDLPLPSSAAGETDLPPPPSDGLPPPPGGDFPTPPTGDGPPLPGGDPPPAPGEGQSDDAPLAIPLEGDDGSTTEPLAEDSAQLPLFGVVNASDLGMPLFTILIGLVDGFNPCAMWVLLFLLSILVNLKDRRKMFAIAGVFVLISGLAYFAFMAAWLEVWTCLSYERTVQTVLGCLAIVVGAIHIKDFFAFKKGVSLSIPDSARSKINQRVRKIVNAETLWAAMIGASVLAVLVNLLELLCTAGFPAIYTKVLQQQGYERWQELAYIGLYNLAYMFDDSIMVIIAVVTLGRRRLEEKEGRWLKFISGALIFLLGVILLTNPELLMWS